MLGSWQAQVVDDDNRPMIHRLQLVDNYLVYTIFGAEDAAFLGTMGGTIQLNEQQLTIEYEFNTFDSTTVGLTDSIRFSIVGEQIVNHSANITLAKSSDQIQSLDGAWTITGRMRDGEVQRRTVGARKTMKVLAGGYFQWIAFNMDTAEFRGTGGGAYQSVEGKYVEKIQFFSRDRSRAGAELSFDYELNEEEWHHKGLSSKGQPIYEIWSRLNK